ncbi:MAG: pyridoxal phosphate-dependent aminotransferase [Methanobrevibacter sp.]|jgi:aspartate aminotransferase|nr:pyridoxal phosphate-dependent aminotransferase [Candidatus Methanoflexus mossambicus]
MINVAKRLESIELSQIRKMFEAKPEGAINLGLGEPDFDIPENVKIAMKNALDEGFTHYTHNMGMIELREAIASKLKSDNNIKTNSDSVMVTVGASEALFITCQGLFQEEDEVLIPDPGFVSYTGCVNLSGANPVFFDLDFDNSYKMTVEDIQDKISSKTKGLILNSPSNPTGAVMDKKDIKAICDLATDYDFTIISDEIYEKIVYDAKHYSPGEFSDNVITINGFSKSYAMTGLRIAYLAGNQEIVDELLKVHQYNIACASSISQIGALEALKGPQNYVKNIVNEFKNRRDLITNRLNNMGLTCSKTQGSFYVFPKVNAIDENKTKFNDGIDFANKSLDAGVVTTPGGAFGKNSVNNVRMSYATSFNEIEEAMDRLETIT